MRYTKVWTRNHHSPWLTMFAQAFPECAVFVTPTAHAPEGWRHDQRPMPLNVSTAFDDFADVILLHTPLDMHSWGDSKAPKIYIAHNRAIFDGGENVAFTLNTYGVPMVAISEMKAQSWRDAGYKGEITVIPPYIDTSLYSGWTGEGGYILTVCNGLDRPLFDKAAWLEATRDLPVKLVGEGNQGIRGAVGPAQSWEDLKSLYRCARVYLSVNKWPNEDGYNLSLLEAMATGVPCVVSRNETAPHDGVLSGGTDLRGTVEAVLRSLGHRSRLTTEGRESMRRRFPLSTFRDKWLSVLERVTA